MYSIRRSALGSVHLRSLGSSTVVLLLVATAQHSCAERAIRHAFLVYGVSFVGDCVEVSIERGQTELSLREASHKNVARDTSHAAVSCLSPTDQAQLLDTVRRST